jgi:AbrB family looped-hinge helix DNA binding protein
MGGTYSVVMGDRGRLVVPAELRERWQLHSGARLLLIETADGIVLANREQVKQLVRSQLAGTSLAKELISERRAEAAREAAS